jgi:hypothetical protein
MQRKMFLQSFADAGLDVSKDLTAIDVRDMTTDQAVEKVSDALTKLEGKS